MRREPSAAMQHKPDAEGTPSRGRTYATPEYFSQRQDHFDDANNRTWWQAYYVNSTFWRGADSGAPIFLCIGGEGKYITGKSVAWSRRCNLVVEMLQAHGALMLALEHRFYGCHVAAACPFVPIKETPPLRLLAIEQVLADLASFHAHASKREPRRTCRRCREHLQ